MTLHNFSKQLVAFSASYAQKDIVRWQLLKEAKVFYEGFQPGFRKFLSVVSIIVTLW